EEFRVRAQQHQRADRIRPLPREGHPLVTGQGFGQYKEPVTGVHQAERRCAPKWEPRIDRTEPPAYGGAEYEPEAEPHADLAERRGPVFRSRHVGNVRTGGAEA